jgi:hypothetical protein
MVERGDKVGGGVDQRAVEIEHDEGGGSGHHLKALSVRAASCKGPKQNAVRVWLLDCT